MNMMQTSREPRAQVFTRSLESCAFEEFWRGMRGASLIPARKDFNLARAARFIRDLVLMEAPHPDHEGMRIRVAGESYQQFAGCNLSGIDHLELTAPEFRDGARITGELMVTTPCGLWQVSPLHG
ncbi:MAG TPA: PAS domain-containing protein, partial [Rhizomicrobium sp.]|nr:PAS domain-containing protein [Rhizomicrobium sp.]